MGMQRDDHYPPPLKTQLFDVFNVTKETRDSTIIEVEELIATGLTYSQAMTRAVSSGVPCARVREMKR